MTVAERRELDRERVRAVGQREEAAYRARTPRSAELHVRAQRAMPLGVASSFQIDVLGGGPRHFHGLVSRSVD